MKQANEVFTWIETKVQNTPILFTTDKYDDDSLSVGFYSYDVGFNENSFKYEILAKQIKRNVIAKIVCYKVLKLDSNGQYRLNDADLILNSVNKFTNFDDYFEKYKVKS